MKWSAQQEDALKSASRWLQQRDSHIFRLFGYAGTGKTTLAQEIAQQVDGDVVFGAFTGKAAHVLRQKGCEGAQTIHSLIYRPSVAEDEEETESPLFTIRRDAPAGEAALIIIDECSMVDEDLGRDLLSFGAPVLVLGDPAQLPPVKGGGYFTEAEPDVMLTEVHRQAEESAIVRLSMQIRNGEVPAYGDYGDAHVISKKEVDPESVDEVDQVLVGTNRTRQRYNERLRERQGYDGDEPWVGERLVCLRNNKQKGLLNGSMWKVAQRNGKKRGMFRLDIEPEDGGRKARVAVLPEFFSGEAANLPWPKRRNSDEFDFGYALTVHKAQGSQWNNVMLFDESYAFREHRMAWLYTGVTRAAEAITIVR